TISATTATADNSTATSPCLVIYYGTFIPNHGVLTIVEAARYLASEPTIQLVLIGQGPDRAAAEALAQRYNLPNITFIDWLAQDALVQQVADATVVLGAFGTTPQSLMTVQNKIYEGLALGKPVLSGDGPAVRAALIAGEEIELCARNDGAALADAIRRLCADPARRAQLAERGHRRFLCDYALAPLGRRYKTHLQETANRA
ncbi:MAG: glycosyltransferase, partial [Caldilineaceae bacterium]|nr:glycosyltransferase [Caldilineaceae bacterium]